MLRVNKTVCEIRQKKEKLRKDIQELCTKFSDETGCIVSTLNMDQIQIMGNNELIDYIINLEINI